MRKQSCPLVASRWLATVVAMFLCREAIATDALLPPPQDQGLPYTKSAQPKALQAVENATAVFVGSRYGYIHGFRTRLDPANILAGEAVSRDGSIYVPAAFAAAITGADIRPDPIPSDLAPLQPRWVYTFISRRLMCQPNCERKSTASPT